MAAPPLDEGDNLRPLLIILCLLMVSLQVSSRAGTHGARSLISEQNRFLDRVSASDLDNYIEKCSVSAALRYYLDDEEIEFFDLEKFKALLTDESRPIALKDLFLAEAKMNSMEQNRWVSSLNICQFLQDLGVEDVRGQSLPEVQLSDYGLLVFKYYLESQAHFATKNWSVIAIQLGSKK